MRLLTTVFAAALTLAQLGGQTPLIKQLRELTFAKRPAEAQALFESQRRDQRGLSPEWLAAMSWVGRAGAIGGDWDMAEAYLAYTFDNFERVG